MIARRRVQTIQRLPKKRPIDFRDSHMSLLQGESIVRDRREIARLARCTCADNARVFETTLPSAIARLAPAAGRRRKEHCSRDFG
jgi:hypothetical protein